MRTKTDDVEPPARRPSAIAPELIRTAALRTEIELLVEVRTKADAEWFELAPGWRRWVTEFVRAFEEADFGTPFLARFSKAGRLGWNSLANNKQYFRDLRLWHREMQRLSIIVRTRREEERLHQHLYETSDIDAMRGSDGYKQMLNGETTELTLEDLQRRRELRSRATG